MEEQLLETKLLRALAQLGLLRSRPSCCSCGLSGPSLFADAGAAMCRWCWCFGVRNTLPSHLRFWDRACVGACYRCASSTLVESLKKGHGLQSQSDAGEAACVILAGAAAPEQKIAYVKGFRHRQSRFQGLRGTCWDPPAQSLCRLAHQLVWASVRVLEYARCSRHLKVWSRRCGCSAGT